MTALSIRALMDEAAEALGFGGHAWRKTIVCRAEDEEKVTTAAELAGPGFRILTSRLVPEGKIVFVDDEKLDESVFGFEREVFRLW